MIGTTLGDIRRYVESLASDAGTYYLACARTAVRPAPADGLTFDTRVTARAAARATEQYREALRRYDPKLPYYDVIVRERPDGVEDGESVCDVTRGRGHPASARDERDPSGPRSDAGVVDGAPINGVDDGAPITGVDGGADRPVDRSARIDFCHTVAGAVFETIADSPHDGVECAIVDTYLDAAETIDCPDELCLRMIESIAVELDARLDPLEQARLLLSAADRIAPRPVAADPLSAALSSLVAVGVVGGYDLRPVRTDPATGARSWTARIDAYEFCRSTSGVITLPLSVEVFRRTPAMEFAVTGATAGASTSHGPTITIAASETGGPAGLLAVSDPGLSGSHRGDHS